MVSNVPEVHGSSIFPFRKDPLTEDLGLEFYKGIHLMLLNFSINFLRFGMVHYRGMILSLFFYFLFVVLICKYLRLCVSCILCVQIIRILYIVS